VRLAAAVTRKVRANFFSVLANPIVFSTKASGCALTLRVSHCAKPTAERSVRAMST